MLMKEAATMQDFPGFMKNAKNCISSTAQNTKDIEGYYYTGADGGAVLI